MKTPRQSNAVRQRPAHRPEQASARVILLVLVCFAVGIAAGVFWMHRGQTAATGKESAGAQPALSSNTVAVLQHLGAPVELRYYAMLDPTSTSPSMQAFAGRVGQLLTAYERQAGGKLKVTRYGFEPNSPVEGTASADGIRAFNREKGEACFFGIAVACNGKKEALPYLSPDWEQAVEADLSRAINRVAESAAPAQAPSVTPPPGPGAVADVKRLLPNLDSLSLEEGTQKLREAGLGEFGEAVQEMDAKVKEAQQRVLQAQSGQSEADQQASIQQLKDVQAAQTAKLQQIASTTQARIEALRQLKTPSR